MKAHDLIHGGLYLIGDSQIVRFNALNGCFYILDGDFFGSPFADAESGEIECFTINKNWLKVSPIPLTPEILEKNGFNADNFFNWWTIDNPRYKSENIVAYYGVDDDVSDAFLGHWAFDENYAFDYVHELQHALRLCGLHDLADNFKI